MTGALYGLARFCARHRFWILTVWLVVAVALVGVSHRLGDNTNDNLTLPGTGSRNATDALAKSFPDQANVTSPIVLHVSSRKLTDSKYAGLVNQAPAGVAKARDVASVVNPLTSQGVSALSKDQAAGVSVGDLVGQSGAAVGRGCKGHHQRRGPAGPGRRHPGRNRLPARGEGVHAVHRGQRADRDPRRE